MLIVSFTEASASLELYRQKLTQNTLLFQYYISLTKQQRLVDPIIIVFSKKTAFIFWVQTYSEILVHNGTHLIYLYVVDTAN